MKIIIVVLILIKIYAGSEKFHHTLTHDLISFINKTHELMKIRCNDESSDESTTTNSVQSAEAEDFLNIVFLKITLTH